MALDVSVESNQILGRLGEIINTMLDDKEARDAKIMRLEADQERFRADMDEQLRVKGAELASVQEQLRMRAEELAAVQEQLRMRAEELASVQEQLNGCTAAAEVLNNAILGKHARL